MSDREHDDKIIDLINYLQRREEEAGRERSTFAFHGGEGERSRFALPLWRMAYLVAGRHAALVWHPVGVAPDRAPPTTEVVLDLAVDPPRLEFPARYLEGVGDVEGTGGIFVTDESVAVHLGELHGRRWYLVVDDLDAAPEPLDPRAIMDIHFLAGETAGLLFHRGLHEGPRADLAPTGDLPLTDDELVRMMEGAWSDEDWEALDRQRAGAGLGEPYDPKDWDDLDDDEDWEDEGDWEEEGGWGRGL